MAFKMSDIDGKVIFYRYDKSSNVDGRVAVVLSSIYLDTCYVSYKQKSYFNDFKDTRTVVIIGLGHREEYLINEALSDAADDLTADMLKQTDRLYSLFHDIYGAGRYFATAAFPILSGTLKVYCTHQGIEELLQAQEYECNLIDGYIVLDHPLELQDTLRVSYMAKPDINDPELFTDIDTLIKKHGSPSLNNTLSLAAKLAFENGAIRVLACQASEDDSYFTDAYQVLEKEEGYWIVPVPKIETCYTSTVVIGRQHVDKMSLTKNRKERMLICGEVDNTYEQLSRIDAVDINSKRVVLVTPTVSTMILDGETTILDGRFIAAAVAGKLSGLDKISLPLTNKTLQGFMIAKQYDIKVNRNRLTRTGVTFVGSSITGGVVWHGVTTIQNDIAEEQEISIVRVSDCLIKNIRVGLDNSFIGKPLSDTLMVQIYQTITNRLEMFVQQEMIKQYSTVVAKIDKIEPRQINIRFEIEPIYPLNVVSIVIDHIL